MARFVLLLKMHIHISSEAIMPNVHIDNVGDMAVVECEGRFVRSDAAFKLRDAVTSQSDARVVVLDLTEMEVIGGGVIGMLVFLQRWAYDHDIRFKLFNPIRGVREKLEHASSMSAFEIAGLDEMMALLAHADRRYALAS
jgi:anti-anti-sigma regulatory factor